MPAEIHLRVELDAGTAARQARDRAAVEEPRRKAKRAAARRAQLKRHHPPVNLLGGHRFEDAPLLDLEPPPAALHPITPLPDDPLEVPAFLDRTRFFELEEAAHFNSGERT